MELPGDIRKKLEDGRWRFDQLPAMDGAIMWETVKSECNFTSPELSELKNARCPAQAAQAGGGQDDINSMLSASFYIHLGDHRGNAVAITATKALTALHGKCSVGDKVKLVDSSGQDRNATVSYSQFVENEVDIAVVEVDAGEKEFSFFIPVCAKPVYLLQEVIVIARKSCLSNRESSIYASIGRVTFIEPSAPLFQSAYTCHDGLSGAGVIATVEGGKYHVVGVHVASHDNTVTPPPIKKKKGGVACADSVTESSLSLSESIHGHTSFALICEVNRVVGIDAVI
jgi:hypothetical protein